MTKSIKVIDLFAGPGGLAEGFASVRSPGGERVFDICLSIEKERSAHQTLLLRSFVRKFSRGLPPGYEEFARGEITLEDLKQTHVTEWGEAESEARCLELGNPSTTALIDPILDALRTDKSSDCVLVGGPPCQAYSLVGRARNRGIKGYVPEEDHRHFLYQEYIRILRRLEPAVFVMENVKGMLSASVEGKSIFSQVLRDLQDSAPNCGGYVLIPLSPSAKGHEDFLVRSEEFGIPQARHRVIIFGVRGDVAKEFGLVPGRGLLRPAANPANVLEAIGGLPKLRSGLSKQQDGDLQWRGAVLHAVGQAAAACGNEGLILDGTLRLLENLKLRLKGANAPLARSSQDLPAQAPKVLNDWLRANPIDVLTDHETRGHRIDDLSRYVFAATFAEANDRSPSSREFPQGLAPDHASWSSGKFADRFKVQVWHKPSSTITSHISKDGHYFIHPDPTQCRSLTVREAARLQTFPDNYLFQGNRTQKYVQVGNAVPPLLAYQIGRVVASILCRDIDEDPILRKSSCAAAQEDYQLSLV